MGNYIPHVRPINEKTSWRNKDEPHCIKYCVGCGEAFRAPKESMQITCVCRDCASKRDSKHPEVATILHFDPLATSDDISSWIADEPSYHSESSDYD